MRGGWSRADASIMAGAATVTWASRATLRGRDLYTWDSGLLAAGIVRFDFLHAQPHAPFYPLTIFLGKAVAPMVGPIMALVWLSVMASGVMVAATYAVARHLLGRAAATFATFLAFAAPVSLFNGIVPLSYSLEGAASVGVAWAALAHRARRGTSTAIILAVALSAAVGIRPSSMVFLGPVALWAVWGRWQELGIALAAGAAATLAWLVPALAAGGGWRAFQAVNAYQSRTFILHDPVWAGGWASVADKGSQLLRYIPDEAPFLAIVAAAGLVTATGWRPGWRTGFWLAWSLPALAFFTLVYAGWPIFPTGYVMVLVPAFAVAAAGLLQHVWSRVQVHDAAVRRAGSVAVAVIAIVPLTWLGAWDEADDPMRDAEDWAASWHGLEEAFPSNSTAILTFYEWSWAKLDHGDHLSWVTQPWQEADGPGGIQVEQTRHGRDLHGFYANVLDGPDDALHPIPEWVDRIVLLEGHPWIGDVELTKPSIPLFNATLPSGRVVRYFEPANLPNIEAAFLWTDEAGFPVAPTTEAA